MDVIKVEPGSFDETCESDYHLVDAKHEFLVPIVKSEATQEDTCDVTTIKEEVKNEIKAEEHTFYLGRSYSANGVSLAVGTSKEEVKDEISKEEHEVCLDSIEDFINEEHGTACSAASESIGGNSFILPKYSGNEEYKGEKCELHKTQSLCDSSGKTFRCDICKKHFKNRRSLVIHIRIHSDEKPFKCELCNKRFMYNSVLTVHSRTHSGEKPFKCQVCNKLFRRSESLKNHSRIHTGEKPFKCVTCSKCFTDRSSLWVHSRIHSSEKPFKCIVCNKSFIRAEKLETHTRIHTGEKPFKCELCNIRFRENSHLMSHSRIHW